MLNMGNERITENIVRDFLREKGYYNNKSIIIEEQKSTNPRIHKLLQNASKKGSGVGKPEFIISFTDDSTFIIVIECKAEVSQHESVNRDKYSEYAVDGVLLYSSYLSQDFNVLAIAVSGETVKELKVSHFLQLKNGLEPREISDKFLLSYNDYKLLFKEQSSPLQEDDLIKKAIQYNEELHSYSVPEVERCTFISCILTSLQDTVFKDSYSKYENNVYVINNMLEACRRVLEKNKIEDSRKSVILAEYSKIKSNIIFTSPNIKKKYSKTEEPNTILKEFIKDLKENVLPFVIENNFDILGRFYREFIRYAGSDSKTGLVLTPFHVTDFFCDLVDLKHTDVVYDCCCGTGGFLVSAMKKMLADSGNNQDEYKKIKSERILGVEKRADMFTHACSNMMMRGDGKSHIYQNDCFSEESTALIKEQKPTVSFLNPPYDVGPDGQLEFVEHALDVLQMAGRCVAICQMSTVVGNNKKLNAVKERLLKKHTLKAVFSMPDNLFHPVGVVTCILVFEAHTPHPKNQEAFFGYFKDDGHIKRKNKGRVDTGTWKEKKETMLTLYKNKKNKAGLSVTQCVNAKDEWCAEAYMETDYSTLTEIDFIKTIKEYVAFRVKYE